MIFKILTVNTNLGMMSIKLNLLMGDNEGMASSDFVGVCNNSES